MKAVYYNEIDPFAAQWLRELMKAGVIPEGEVDERSIVDVDYADVRGYTQCHFFAGIGVWAYALRSAGWPDERSVWTGSCPCPSFSAAGKGQGFDDARHLWPHWFGLIQQCRPAAIFGEQVNAAIGFGWLDLVQSDLEGEEYAVGKAVFGACDVGAPHIRQRLYFVAESLQSTGERRAGGILGAQASISGSRIEHGSIADRFADGGEDGDLGQSTEGRRRPWSSSETLPGEESCCETWGSVATGELGDASRARLPQRERDRQVQREALESPERQAAECGSNTDNFWADAEWLYCRDGKYRPVEPGTFPLAYGVTGRVGRLRGYGNALCAPQAQAFIEAYLAI